MIYQALIVDDEEIVCRGLAQFVKWREHSFEVAGIAYSMGEALNLLQKTHIDVVFTDIRMPGNSGLELLQKLKESYPETKAVILSGHSDFSYAKEAVRLNAMDYLTKPVNIKEMEELLDRLCAEFDRQREEARIHASRMEELLLLAAKGTIDPCAEKYHFPILDQWYGAALTIISRWNGEEWICEKKGEMKRQIAAVVPEALLLDSEMYSIFALIPYRSETETETLVGILDQLCQMSGEWACGISKYKTGVKRISDAWKEAAQALRYKKASAKAGVIIYKNIEPLFSEEFPQLQDILSELFRRLVNPEMREDILPWLSDSLSELQWSVPIVVEFQTFCIRGLIELNSFLQNGEQKIPELPRRLNEALGSILRCKDIESTIHCVMNYMEGIITSLGEPEQQMGKGAISEMQSYIRSHYAENITLDMLAEQFFFHPNYLSRLFKEKTGKNFVEYLTEVRMEKAKELLENTDYKVIEICSMTGYDNARYFSKVFKQFTGMTPQEFRKQNL